MQGADDGPSLSGEGGSGGDAVEEKGALSSLVRLLISLFLLSLILLHMAAG